MQLEINININLIIKIEENMFKIVMEILQIILLIIDFIKNSLNF